MMIRATTLKVFYLRINDFLLRHDVKANPRDSRTLFAFKSLMEDASRFYARSNHEYDRTKVNRLLRRGAYLLRRHQPAMAADFYARAASLEISPRKAACFYRYALELAPRHHDAMQWAAYASRLQETVDASPLRFALGRFGREY